TPLRENYLTTKICCLISLWLQVLGSLSNHPRSNSSRVGVALTLPQLSREFDIKCITCPIHDLRRVYWEQSLGESLLILLVNVLLSTLPSFTMLPSVSQLAVAQHGLGA